MSFKIAKLPLPVKGRRSTSSHTCDGIPKKLKTGAISFVIKSVMPLTLKSATDTMIATIKGKMLTTKSIAPFAPLTKMLYVFRFLYEAYNSKIMIKTGTT